MASSMLTGERRWVSARRGGMTVLGKVAVPKPVNLPSQRLENHGLDPNVEIVPKGTLSWGSRSSSASNAWGSPALSPPNTSGGTGSRPSSGGTGTRPSTAGSERSHEPVPNAWASASRPSSASAVFVSNQTSIGARPRSADTRPGSSQLSRFAEPVSENSGTAERLGSSSKINSFNLSSGDFPTLGSEKNMESHVREDHSSQGRPTSASGVATPKEKLEILRTEDESTDTNQRGTVSTWKRESSPYDGSGNPPNMEKWQRETHPYSNPNMPPQHFDHWHGAPVRHAPDGVWYRGPTGGPPYGPPGPPGPPGNYPVEPFGYYRPQLPARPLANSQAGPRPGTGLGGYGPKNGDSYRPHMPDSFVQPVMAVRPCVYPGPVPYDGYYGPPRVGLCNSNERDAPVMGMTTGPYVYGRYPPIQNMHPDSGNFYARPGGYGPTNAAMSNEHVESEHPYNSHRGPYKVLLKHHNDWEGNDGKEKREQEHAVANTAHSLEKGSRPGTPAKKSDSKGNHRHEDLVDKSRTVVSGEVSSHPADTTKNLPENMSRTKPINEGLVNKQEISTNPKEDLHPLPKKTPTLMDKIESLNSKARISDDRYDVGHAPGRDEKKKSFRVANAKADRFTIGADHGAFPLEKSSTSGMLSSTYVASASAGDKRLDPTVFSGTVVSRSFDPPSRALNSSGDGDMSSSHINKRSLGAQSRADYRGKGRPHSQEGGEEWRKISHVTDSSIMATVKNVESSSTVNLLDQHATQEATKKPDVLLVEGEPHAAFAVDPTDYKVQRAKMREIATQRAKQLQKEEEERTREQKAKALAKLEELNRRAQAENSTEKTDCVLPASEVLEHKKESSAAPMADPSNFNVVPSSTLGLNSGTEMNKTAHRIGESSESLKIVSSKASACAPQDPAVTDDLPLPLPLPVTPDMLSKRNDVTDEKAASQVVHSSVPKQKQMGYKRRQNIPTDKNSSDKSVPTGNVGEPKNHGIMGSSANASSGETNLPGNTNTSDDPLLQHKKKNNKSGKNKNKSGESSLSVGVAVPLEGSPAKASVEISKLKNSEHTVEVSTIEVPTSKESLKGRDSQDTPSADQGWTIPTEENTHNRVNHWKPQPSRRMPRNTQGSRGTEKPHNSDAVVWAPVRSLNKNETSDEPNENIKLEVHAPANGHVVQNHQKNRRAEMERYVPKPVAKEMSQQGNTQRPLSPSVNQAVSEGTGRADSGSPTNDNSGSDILKVGSVVVSKNGEIKNNKHGGKTHGLWRQRGTSESQSHVVNPSHEGSSISSDRKAVQKPIDPPQQSSLKPETLPKVQAKHYDNWNEPILTEPISVPVVVKEHGVANRGKRQQAFKGNKSTGHNSQNTLDHKDVLAGDTVIAGSQPSHSELDHLEVKITFGEFEHSPSHWQPKSQTYSVHNRQQASRVHGGQKAVTQVSKAPESEFSAQAGGRLPASRNDKGNSTTVVQPLPESSNQETNVAGVPWGCHQETKRERKSVVDSSKEHPSSPNPDPINLAKPVLSENIDKQPEQSFSSGVRKHGHQSARYGRGQEVPHGGRGQVVQDRNIKQQQQQQQQPGSSDRRSHNSHYEYQPAKSYNNESHEPVEGGSRGGGGGGGSRYRERGQTHSRRGGGNFHGRNNSNREMSASYGNNGE